MSTRDINTLRDELLKNRIELSDTISQFMEKCNNNFSAIVEWGGNPDGTKGEKGDQGVPTKPKVPIHVWRIGEEYNNEAKSPDGGFEIYDWNEDLSDVKYQEGHLIMLENANIYILESDNNFNLKPKYIVSLNSYNSDSIVDGRNAYVHFAYADSPDGKEGFKTDQELRTELGETESITTFSLTRGSNSGNSVVVDKPYMGVYSDNTQDSMREPRAYTWFRVRGNDGSNGANGSDGAQGPQGPKGEKGEKGDQGDPGDAFTGHPYTIDLEGDMSTISIDIDRTRLYDKSGDYCKCIAHAYYGDENIKIDISKETTKVEVRLPEEYKYSDEIPNRILKVEDNSVVGVIEIKQANNDVDVEIKFTPDEEFKFPKKTILFTVHIEDSVYDKDDGNIYNFVRDTVWMIKGIMSTFELEIMPHYRSIKLFENGDYYPENLLVDVYKVEDSERTIFNFGQNPDFTLLYKDYNNNEWETYPSEGVSTKGVSCLEFKVVRYLNSTDPLKPEEIWDYEDVWVVADGKSTHYYHADLGSAESMMVLTTGEKININTNENEDPLYCAKLRNEDGYSITFDLKFYDGTEELKVIDVDIYQNGSDNYYYLNETFKREIGEITTESETIDEVTVTKYKSTFTVTRVPYNVEMIPMTFTVTGEVPVYDSSGNILKTIYEKDTVSFNVYISTLTNTYTLIPTVSAYNTSTGKDGDKIGCNVYKNDVFIDTPELSQNGLTLEYIVHNDDSTDYETRVKYTEPLVYGNDDDYIKDDFTASDVAIEFILSYSGKEVARSTVPLVKDGINGADGDCWQYIFCRSPYYPFNNPKTNISNPSKWTKDPNPNDSNSEYLGNKEDDYAEDPNKQWYDDHKGVDSIYRYEYQSYRKWDKDNKKWSTYMEPTLYSNYSESGSGYSVLLSNPVAVIPVGSNWRTEEGHDNQFDSTLVYLYNNTSNISDNPKVFIEIDIPNTHPHYNHFELSKNNEDIHKITFKPVVDTNDGVSIFEFEPNTPYKVPIKLTYNFSIDNDNDNIEDNFSTTINWILTPITGLEDVEVFVDQRVVNNTIGSQHRLKVGYYLISSNSNKQFIEEDDENNTKGYKIILTNDIGKLTPTPESNNVVLAETWSNVVYNFVDEKGNRNCYVVLVEPYTNESGKVEYNIIDYIDVTSVSDGKSSIHLELTQDYIALPCKAEGGGVHDDYDEENNPIKSQMKLYNGDKLIDSYDLISYNFKKDTDIDYLPDGEIKLVKNESGKNDGTFIVPKKLIKGDTNIECIATYNGTQYHKTLFIDLEKTPYELEINKNVLTRDVNANIIIDEKITVSVKCWIEGEWKYIKYGEVKAITNKTTDQFTTPSGVNYERTLTISGSNLKNNTTDTDVRISFIKDNKELSYETIGIINSGKDGSAPTLLSTKRIGFSLNEKADINIASDWVTSLDGEDYKNLSPGTPIYVLYERIWKYDNGIEHKERYVTATLSGSQGVEGKSRVLFYRGSYDSSNGKTPTLTEEYIEGLLDDNRCDYYIDKAGFAWMRTGTDISAKGYPDSSDNNPDGKIFWVQADVVGFLQAGAITADMINAGSITVDTGFVKELFSLNIEAKNLKVDAGKITGDLDANEVNIKNLTVESAQITGDISGHTIKSNIPISATDDTATWQINNTGAGWLANKNIEWDSNGNITLKGTIIGGNKSQLGIWNVWSDGTISTDIQSNSSNPMIKFAQDGSGQLCFGNIHWDTDGTLYFGGKDKPEVHIGDDAWVVNADGITSKNNIATFNNDGSGQIGGYHKDKNGDIIQSQKKGISWDENGDVIFHDKVIIKPEYIHLNGNETESSKTIHVNSDTSTFVFIDGENPIVTDDGYVRIYLSWFSLYKNAIDLDDDSFCNFTLINHANKSLYIYIENESLILPYRQTQDSINPQINYKLSNTRNANEGKYDKIYSLFILPGSKLELCLENFNSNRQFYINNISDFRLTYDKNANISLISTNYDVNTYNNIGGYGPILNTLGGKSHVSLLRLIFGNNVGNISRAHMTGTFRIPYFTQFIYVPESSTTHESMKPRIDEEDAIDSKHNILETYNIGANSKNIEFIGNFEHQALENTQNSLQLKLTITQNLNNKYSQVRLICYSPLYDTMYKGNYVNIITNKEFAISLPKKYVKKLNDLAFNQPNSILDVFVIVDFK